MLNNVIVIKVFVRLKIDNLLSFVKKSNHAMELIENRSKKVAVYRIASVVTKFHKTRSDSGAHNFEL